MEDNTIIYVVKSNSSIITPEKRENGVKIAFSSSKICLYQVFAVILQHKNPPSLFTMLKSAGRFLFIPMAHYTKSYSDPSALVALLKYRGLGIDNDEKATHYLTRIGYYRMSAYFYPLLAMPKENHRYKFNATFRQALEMYRFDRQLRLLIFNQIEKIEIAVRAAMVDVMCRETNDPFWMTNPQYFADGAKFSSSLQKIQQEYNKSREDFIEHFRTTYVDPFPPSWMLAEILPLGVLTRIYENIRVNRYRKLIAQEFGLNIPVFTSWMTIITVTRNSCCHHARVWNRAYTLRAQTLTRNTRPWISSSIPQGKIFYTLLCCRPRKLV